MSVEHALEFKNYLLPLCLLEKSLKTAGLRIEFEAVLSTNGDKRIEINYGRGLPHMISIEGDNPAEAVKDVSAAVRL